MGKTVHNKIKLKVPTNILSTKERERILRKKINEETLKIIKMENKVPSGRGILDVEGYESARPLSE